MLRTFRYKKTLRFVLLGLGLAGVAFAFRKDRFQNGDVLQMIESLTARLSKSSYRPNPSGNRSGIIPAGARLRVIGTDYIDESGNYGLQVVCETGCTYTEQSQARWIYFNAAKREIVLDCASTSGTVRSTCSTDQDDLDALRERRSLVRTALGQGQSLTPFQEKQIVYKAVNNRLRTTEPLPSYDAKVVDILLLNDCIERTLDPHGLSIATIRVEVDSNCKWDCVGPQLRANPILKAHSCPTGPGGPGLFSERSWRQLLADNENPCPTELQTLGTPGFINPLLSRNPPNSIFGLASLTSPTFPYSPAFLEPPVVDLSFIALARYDASQAPFARVACDLVPDVVGPFRFVPDLREPDLEEPEEEVVTTPPAQSPSGSICLRGEVIVVDRDKTTFSCAPSFNPAEGAQPANAFRVTNPQLFNERFEEAKSSPPMRFEGIDLRPVYDPGEGPVFNPGKQEKPKEPAELLARVDRGSRIPIPGAQQAATRPDADETLAAAEARHAQAIRAIKEELDRRGTGRIVPGEDNSLSPAVRDNRNNYAEAAPEGSGSSVAAPSPSATSHQRRESGRTSTDEEETEVDKPEGYSRVDGSNGRGTSSTTRQNAQQAQRQRRDSAAAEAGTSNTFNHDCNTKIDLVDSPPPRSPNSTGPVENPFKGPQHIRHLDSIGWGRAYAMADLLSYRSGQFVSGMDVGILAHDRDFDGQYADEMRGGQWDADLGNFYAKLKQGRGGQVCLESGLRSNDFAFSEEARRVSVAAQYDDQRGKNNIERGAAKVLRAAKAVFDIFHSRTGDSPIAASTGLCQNLGLLTTLFPNFDMQQIMQAAMADDNNAFIDFLSRQSCENHSVALPENLRVVASGGSDNMAALNDQLSRNNPVAVVVALSVIDNAATSEDRRDGLKTEGNITLTVVGREKRDGQCLYRVRTNWGASPKACGRYYNDQDPDIQSLNCGANFDTENGTILVDAAALQAGLKSGFYFDPPAGASR